MTYKQLEALYPIIRDVIWDVPETVGKLRASGAKKFGIEVQQAGLQRILFEFAKLGFETCEIIETEVNHAENEYINRYVLVLRDVSEDNSRLLELENETIESIRTFEDINGAEPDGCRHDDPRFAGYIEERLKAAVEAVALQRAYAIVTGKAYDTAAEYLHTMARARCPECGAYVDHAYNCCTNRGCDWTD